MCSLILQGARRQRTSLCWVVERVCCQDCLDRLPEALGAQAPGSVVA